MNPYSIIEVSDICIRAYEDGKQIYAEPGVALLQANAAPIIGYQAQKLIRQQPTRIHSRFWSDLSTTPLSMKQTGIRHSADLVWHQLAQIKESLTNEEVVFCLSSHLNDAQMQLLAGICESLELRAHYLLNLGLSQLLANELPDSAVHLDLQLHQLVVSRFITKEGQFQLSSQESVPGISYLQLIDRMVHALREQFIQATRFDPLHSGDTEQQLFDQVSELIHSSNLKPIEIITAGQSYRVEPSLKDFGHVISMLCSELDKLAPTDSQRALSPVFFHLPGLKPSDKDIRLDYEDCRNGAEKLINQQSDSSEGILYVSTIQSEPESAQIPPANVSEQQSESSPVLANALQYQGKVYPLTHIGDLLNLLNAPLGTLETSVQGICSGQDVLVNGAKAESGQLFVTNDEILINQARITAVHLLE